MMDILFYYHYLFYKKSRVETQPVATTIFILSLLLTWDIFIPLVLFFIVCLHINILKMWIYISLFACVAFVMYMYFLKSKRYLKIIKQKPMLHNSNSLSIIFAIGFNILSFLILTLGIIWGKELLQNYYL